jgi:hypothetical protein
LNAIYDYLASGIKGLAHRESAIITGVRPALVVGAGITQGYGVLKGEPYWVEAQTWDPNVITNPVLVPVESVRSPSPKTSADGSSKNVHFTRYAEIQQSAAQPVKYRVRDLADYGFEWYTVYDNGELPIMNFLDVQYDGSGGWNKIGGTLEGLGYRNLKLRKRSKYLELQGCCYQSIISKGTKLFTLPSPAVKFGTPTLRPYKEQVVMIPLSKISPTAGPGNPPPVIESKHWAIVSFKTNGDVVLEEASLSTSDSCMLHFNHSIPLE